MIFFCYRGEGATLAETWNNNLHKDQRRHFAHTRADSADSIVRQLLRIYRFAVIALDVEGQCIKTPVRVLFS